jgi:hypothetical protein
VLNKNKLMLHKLCGKISEITGEFHFVINIAGLNWLKKKKKEISLIITEPAVHTLRRRITKTANN